MMLLVKILAENIDMELEYGIDFERILFTYYQHIFTWLS